MIIDAIADLHGHYPELEGGDLLIVAGDLTAKHSRNEYCEFMEWIMSQRYAKKLFISGNHDQYIQENNDSYLIDYESDDPVEYLCDSGTEFEGLKIYGSPWTLTFPGINPKCTAFTGDEKLLAEKFALIPDDIDILVTHGPPYGVMDEVKRYDFDHKSRIENVGSISLCKALARIRPKLHVFGHIHEGYGHRNSMHHQWIENCCRDTAFINCSHVNERYEPVNKPIRVIL